MKVFKHIGLFEGIGGFSYAAKLMGWKTVAWCEINEFGQRVLRYHYPEAEGFGDIKKTDFTKYANTIDILTGGFPCQPYSTAGKRLGTEDDRHLWPEMLRAIREIQPRYIVGENVRGLTNWNGGLVFDQVQADLENEGYEVLPFLLPACAVNAPHRRDRIWFVAHSNGKRNDRNNGAQGSDNKRQQSEDTEQSGNGWASEIERHGTSGIVAHSPNTRAESIGQGGQDEIHGFETTADTNKFNGDLPGLRAGEISQQQKTGIRENITTDTSDAGLQRSKFNGSSEQRNRSCESHKSTSQFHQIPNWEQFPTQSPVCGGDDGVSGRLSYSAVWGRIKPRAPFITFAKWRNESIKAMGNAVVPQLVIQIFKAIEQIDNLTPCPSTP